MTARPAPYRPTASDTQPQTIKGGLRLIFVSLTSSQVETAACHFPNLGVKYI